MQRRIVCFAAALAGLLWGVGFPLLRAAEKTGASLRAGFAETDITPTLGMDRRGLLQDRRKRARYGLPRELRPPALGTPGADLASVGTFAAKAAKSV